MTGSRTLHVDTLRLRGAAPGHASGMRQAASTWLGAADVHPPGLAPSAVLVVRTLPDPMPQRCGAVAPGSSPSPEWGQAVRQRLGEVARRAARPVDGRIPPHAEAVHFADRAEWAACLALDLAAGTAPSRWWWRAFLRSAAPLDRTDRITRVLTESPETVPAVLAHLAGWRRVGEVVYVLSPEQAALVLDRTATAFELRLPACNVDVEAPYPDEPVSPPGEAVGAHGSLGAPPWGDGIQAAISDDAPSHIHTALVGVGLALHRHPSMAASPSFAAALTRWNANTVEAPESSGTDAPPAGTDPSGPSAVPAPRKPPIPAAREIQEAEAGEASAERPDAPLAPTRDTPPPQSALSESSYPPDAQPRTLPAAPPDLHDEAEVGKAAVSAEDATRQSLDKQPPAFSARPATPQDGARRASSETVPASSANSPTSAHRAVPTGGQASPSASDGRATARSAEAPAADDSVASSTGTDEAVGSSPRSDLFAFRVEPVTLPTDLGGILYLINLMVRLELPARFEESHRLASTVGPWGVLEALGRSLLGPDLERFRDDPLWSALARLDGREPDTRPGEAFPSPQAFVCPMRWVEEGGGLTSPLWGYAGDGRMRVWMAHYLLADCPHDGNDPVATVRKVARELGVRPSRIRLADAPDPWWGEAALPQGAPLLATWTAWVTPFVRYRLAAALDLPLDADLTDALLAVTGVLHLSAMHVDWTAPLDAVSLPVRLAGLDRDPGWVPSFGRVVLFHFD